MNIPIKKCAIYTRKSHEKGLEQEFNTLDAQRESCLAYITSQKSEGWTPIKQFYDDGGYSGGTMERPALRALMDDVKAGKINIVVVYKIDRLTRSLTDFAKLVEVFDQHNVSFVSVTQSFNTTTSMGRLTLNVLLSFAQFEREVIGERIRDKISASKKKGIWMGGCPPLGYDIGKRELVINQNEAKDVRYIFDRYLELNSVLLLRNDLEEKAIKSKSWVSRTGRKYGGQFYCYSALHHLLCNPVYAGYVRHKNEIHEGRHEAIVQREKWLQVQEALTIKAPAMRGKKKRLQKYLLKRKIFDTEGVIYTPLHAESHGKNYRYYTSQNRLQNRQTLKNIISRLPAHEVEMLVWSSVIAETRDVEKLAYMLGMHIEKDFTALEEISKRVEAITDLYSVVKKITVATGQLKIDICLKGLVTLINKEVNMALPMNDALDVHSLVIPYHTKRARRGAVMIRSGDGKDPLDLPKSQLESLVKGTIWRDEHFNGKSFIEIAKESNCSRSFVMQLINYSITL